MDKFETAFTFCLIQKQKTVCVYKYIKTCEQMYIHKYPYIYIALPHIYA